MEVSFLMKRGFTLIELLIVVAIIAILAAIAVPNFLEAQTRAKVARVKNDMRTMATAIESYTVDNNKPPREQNTTFYGSGDQVTNHVGTPVNVTGIMWNGVSTPIAYLTTARYKDVFQDKNLNASLDEQYYTYNDMQSRAIDPPPAGLPAVSQFYGTAPVFYGSWRTISVGPDKLYGHSGTAPTAQLAYDATNGTVSQGNIFRSQKYSDNAQPEPGKTYVNGPYSAILLGAP
jgi:prepilin-type N-terminal cleavage/methylation domain-containing protein